MADLNLQEIHDTLVSVAFEAGRMIMSANPSEGDQGTKLNSVDLVTETDKAVEKMVSTRLRESYPSISFMGEETYTPGARVGPEPTFVVDPIDGTTNFVHAFPSACISLGLAVDKRPAVGVIYNPFQDLLFTAIGGQGAYMHRGAAAGHGAPQRLPLAKNPTPLAGLGSALVGVEWGSDRHGPNFEAKAATFRKLAASPSAEGGGGAMAHSLRSMGSAALNLAAVAAGQLDMYWEGGCWAWDVCAGWCVLAEAGGIVVGGNPGVWEPELDGRVYLAVRGAPSGQKEIVEEFWAVMGDHRLEYSV
ncbi:inositol monophosphatase [Sodiomyces alkalinus F11]|uniref:Inositol-1-monophosphatase n=1 Tax=Sodiomyces alkalinus (strain CBS 110278 / VKM F-3762 / F11) TaxID=1314773 RepID=A0A3N2Q1F1_SODAK|nr:inositol monophosphatase [Sodiomyces alkalinus F11]ROT40591.1 inositol monophosphatase [Sodiomyces alkalinus F11]